MALGSPHESPAYLLLQSAYRYADTIPIGRRQCRLLCDVIHSASSTSATKHVTPNVDHTQQLDDALNILVNKMSIWARYDLVDAFLNSRRIKSDILDLFSELAWCGVSFQDFDGKKQMAEEGDTAELLNLLYTIIRNDDNLHRLSEQSPEVIRFLVHFLQQAEVHSGSREGLNLVQRALIFFYRTVSIDLPTPNLSRQVTDIAKAPTSVGVTTLDYRVKWFEREEFVLKSVRHQRQDQSLRKLFAREVEKLYSLKHQNVLRVHGYILDDVVGFGLVVPWSPNWSVARFIEKSDVPILPLLLDIVNGLKFLHEQNPPIIHGCLCAESVYVDGDGNACIGDVGVANMVVQSLGSLGTMLRWCAPELMRLCLGDFLVDKFALVANEATDVYAFGMTMFRQYRVSVTTTIELTRQLPLIPILYTGAEPFHHIADEDTLAEEVMHGMRPSISADLKQKATKRHLTNEVWSLMRAAWDENPTNRITTGEILDELAMLWKTEQRGSKSVHSSVSYGSDVINPSAQGKLPAERRKQCSPVETHHMRGSPSTQRSRSSLPWSDVRLGEPTSEGTSPTDSPTGFPFGDDEDDNVSADDDEGYVGQVFEQPMDYSKLPRMPSISSSTKRRNTKDSKFHILVSSMTSSQQVHKEWVGVSDMEWLRAHKGPCLRQDRVKEMLMEAEDKFIAMSSNPITVLRDAIEQDNAIDVNESRTRFLEEVVEDRLALCNANRNFLNGLKATPSAATEDGLTKLALLCKEAGLEFNSLYSDYVRRLQEAERILDQKMGPRGYFTQRMQTLDGSTGKTHYNNLLAFLRTPSAHLQQHPLYIKAIMNEMHETHGDYKLLMEAYEELAKAVHQINLVLWQMPDNETIREWSDFVVQESVRGMTSTNRTLQSAFFSLVAEEKAYVPRLKQMKEDIESWHVDADPDLSSQLSSFSVVCDDLLHFHRQLLNNLTVIQRTQHPQVEAFVSMCGIPQIPWHSLYVKRYASAFVGLRELVKGGHREKDTMNEMKVPMVHLQRFMGILRDIYLNTPMADEDRLILKDFLPRLRAVNHRTIDFVIGSKDRSRLARLTCALDYSKFPSIENDVDILSKDRMLLASARLGIERRASKSSQMGQYEEKHVVLLDNYLIFATPSQDYSSHHLIVNEKPIALELLAVLSDKANANHRHPKKVFSISLCYKTNPRLSMSLYADTPESSMAWAKNVVAAIQRREKILGRYSPNQVVALRPFDSTVGVPICSTEFTADERYLAVAHDAPRGGLYVKHMGRQEAPCLRVHLDGISDMVPLPEEKVLLVLANKTLQYYRFEDLINHAKSQQNAHVISDPGTVQFFRLGMLSDQIVLFVLRDGGTTSILQKYVIVERGKAFLPIRRKSKTNIFQRQSEYQVPHMCTDVIFFKNIVYVATKQGFFQLNTKNPAFKGIDKDTPVLPQPNDVRVDIIQRSQKSAPITMYQFNDEYILCYNGFAIYITMNGSLTSKVVYWSTDAPITSIIFRAPYLMLFTESLIEVREIKSGKLLQLQPMTGRLTWAKPNDGNGREYRENYMIHVALPQNQVQPTDEMHPDRHTLCVLTTPGGR